MAHMEDCKRIESGSGYQKMATFSTNNREQG